MNNLSEEFMRVPDPEDDYVNRTQPHIHTVSSRWYEGLDLDEKLNVDMKLDGMMSDGAIQLKQAIAIAYSQRNASY